MKAKARVRAFSFYNEGEVCKIDVRGSEHVQHIEIRDGGGARVLVERGPIELFLFLSEAQLRELRNEIDKAIGISGITKPCDRSTCYDCNRWPPKPVLEPPKIDPTAPPISFTTEPDK